MSENDGRRLASELVALKVDAIVVQTTPAALAAKRATSTIPIVITTAIDPVGAGLAESLARPGGNVTGVALQQPEITAKGLSLLKEAIPSMSQVAVLLERSQPGVRAGLASCGDDRPLSGVSRCCRSRCAGGDFAAAFATMTSTRPEGSSFSLMLL